MANIYPGTPVISKINLNGTDYYLKDADVRSILDTYGTIVTYNASSVVTDNTTIPTGAAIITYINNAVADLAGAMHFKGGVETLPDSADDYENGDVIVVTGTGKEYVVLAGEDGNSFIELGDEQGHVLVTRTIAGIDLKDDIAVDELQTALQLKALAYKDSASGSLDNYVDGIDDITYTPEGTITADSATVSTEIESKGQYTPSGTVSVTLDEVSTEIESTGSYTPAGTVDVTATNTSVTGISDVGTLPNLTTTNSAFAVSGLVGTVDAANEILTLTSATTSNAIVGTEFSAGTLPTAAAAVTVLTGATANFSGAASTVSVNGNYMRSSINSTDFTGDGAELAVTGNYDAFTLNSITFAGNAATIVPNLKMNNKTFTVQ